MTPLRIGLALLAVAAVGGLLLLGQAIRTALARPMFFDDFSVSEDPPMWQRIPVLTDGSGNLLFTDFELNLLVLVETEDPEWSEHHGLGLVTKPEEATLLKGTRFETTVRSERDKLLIVGDRPRSCSLAAGDARRIHEQVQKAKLLSKRGSDLRSIVGACAGGESPTPAGAKQ